MAAESDAQRRIDILRGSTAPGRGPQPTGPTRSESAADVSRDLAAGVAAVDARLGDGAEAGARLAVAGEPVVVHLEAVGHWGPALVVYSGRTADGAAVDVVQHVDQVSLTLISVPRPDPAAPRLWRGWRAGPA